MLKCRSDAVCQVICCVPSVPPMALSMQATCDAQKRDRHQKSGPGRLRDPWLCANLPAASLPAMPTCDLTYLIQVLRLSFERMSSMSAILWSRSMCGDSVHLRGSFRALPMLNMHAKLSAVIVGSNCSVSRTLVLQCCTYSCKLYPCDCVCG